jgi:hypothetical protein
MEQNTTGSNLAKREKYQEWIGNQPEPSQIHPVILPDLLLCILPSSLKVGSFLQDYICAATQTDLRSEYD